ncbi:MAG TPA: AzlD domain-containing protein [Coriobacteriia bacterium]|nr:AzlD domain-containing protein [Coriobacteriia bacterium]
MTGGYVWSVIALMALANFVVRFVPIAVVSRLRLPEPLVRWLSFVPASVMGALVAGEVLRPGGTYLLTLRSPYLLAAIITGIVYHLTRSFLGATVAGMLSFVGIRALLG